MKVTYYDVVTKIVDGRFISRGEFDALQTAFRKRISDAGRSKDDKNLAEFIQGEIEKYTPNVNTGIKDPRDKKPSIHNIERLFLSQKVKALRENDVKKFETDGFIVMKDWVSPDSLYQYAYGLSGAVNIRKDWLRNNRDSFHKWYPETTLKRIYGIPEEGDDIIITNVQIAPSVTDSLTDATPEVAPSPIVTPADGTTPPINLPPLVWKMLSGVALILLLLAGGMLIPKWLTPKASPIICVMKTAWSDNDTFFGGVVKEFVDKVNSDNELQGKFKIVIEPHNIYGSSNKIDANELFDNLKAGEFHLLHTTTYYHYDKIRVENPAFLFAGFPFAREVREQMQWIDSNKNIMQSLFHENGLVTYFGGITGAQSGGWYKEKPTGINWFKGKNVRCGGFAKNLLDVKCGAENTPNIYQDSINFKMQEGKFDWVEWTGGQADIDLGMDTLKSYPFFESSKWNEPSTTFLFLGNEKFFESLPTVIKKRLETILEETFSTNAKDYEGAVFANLLYQKWKENISVPYGSNRKHGKLTEFSLSDTTLDSLRLYTVELLRENHFKSDENRALLKSYLKDTPLDSFLTDYDKKHSTPPK